MERIFLLHAKKQQILDYKFVVNALEFAQVPKNSHCFFQEKQATYAMPAWAHLYLFQIGIDIGIENFE